MNDILALRPDDTQPTPLYLQLARNLEAAIHAGQWKAEQAMPSERSLSEQLGISRVTARKALEVLFEQGLIRRNQGSGTFITPRLEQPLSRLSGFSEMLRLKGFVPGSQWLEREITPPTHEELIRLGLSPTDKVARLKRLRKADNTVMAIEMSTLPASIIPKPQAVGDSLYEFLDGIGKPVVRALQHIQAINASDEFAALVGIAPRHRNATDDPGRLPGRQHAHRSHRHLLPQRLLRLCRRAAALDDQRIPMSEDNILTANGWIRGRLVHEHGKVVSVEGQPCDPASNDLPYLLPGFIDLHVHGGGGKDIMEGAPAFETIARTHVRFGTTALLATTMTAPSEEIASVLKALGEFCEQRPSGSARVLGVHLEGPYINPGKLGAQPNFAHTALMAEVEAYLALAPIRVITIAPEIAGHDALIRALSARGVRMQIGHTLGSYEEGVAALAAGASSFTHLYNAMSPLHHREPGIVGAALAHARYAELIPDLLHVHPGAMRVALRAIPCLYCVTDSTAAAGMPDGEYKLGSHTVTKCLGGVRLADGTLAGSTLTMDQALRNLVKIGLPLAEASQRLSQFPADYLGLPERGRLQPGAWADCVRLDRALNLIDVMVEGEAIDFQNA
nr:hypothetical protein GCM10020185_50740 [Pseudomonas brassicacearum subsp. brassicacearum]